MDQYQKCEENTVSNITFLYTVAEIDECGSNPCENSGTCVDGLNCFYCICDLFHGDICQTGKLISYYLT